MAIQADIRLTQTVTKGGCAAKLAAGDLRDLLHDLPPQRHPDLLVGADLLDDAAVWHLGNEQVMVQTLDFFTPILDDPFDFGAVAAANALSDVFAMGAEPTTALTILAYPSQTLPSEVLRALMAGALERINAAGALLVGGHSIDDDTLKLGFSVTGLGHKSRLWANRQARVGDRLVLTKALGTGTLTGALKSGELPAEALAEAIASMKTLNKLRLPDELLGAVHAATDITGFGLLGHALHLANGSSVTLDIEVERVPLLAHAREALERGLLNRAHHTNTLYVQEQVAGRRSLDDAQWWGLVDPQTSGGLLLSVTPGSADDILEALGKDFPRAAVVGRVLPRGDTPLRVSYSGLHIDREPLELI